MNNLRSNKRIARNTLFLYARMIVVLFVSIYTTRIVLRVLGVEDYGVYNVVCGFVAMFSFLNSSMSNAIQRFYNYEAGKSDGGIAIVYKTSLIIQVLLAIVLLLILETVGLWYLNSKMVLAPRSIISANIVFQCSAISLVFLVIQIPYSAAILAYERMDYYAIVSIIDVFLKLLIVLILPYVPLDKLAFYGFLQLIIAIINFLFYYIYAKRNFAELTLVKTFDKSLFKSISTFSGWNVLNLFAWMTQGQGINMVINLFFGPVVNAARGVSGQIQAAIQGFCQNLVTAFRPQLVQTYAQGNVSRATNMMYSMSKVMFIMYFILSTPVLFDINYILNLWLGDDIPEYTAPFTVLIILSMYPRNFAMAFSQIIHATGNIKGYEVLSALIILLVLPLSYIGLKLGANVLYVFWVNLIICAILFFACMLYLKKVFPFSIKNYLRKVIVPCITLTIVSLIVPVSTLFLMDSSLMRLCINVVMGSIICMITSYYVVLNGEEKSLVKKILVWK